jgi:hypothetical protein
MTQFNLTAKITITAFTTVWADTLKEAIEIANDRADMMSIATNNGDEPDEVWMVEDLDGVPYDIKIESEL